jgi:sodium-dependent phosphate cotransporter
MSQDQIGGHRTAPQLTRGQALLRGLFVLVALFVFLVGIRGLGTGFKGLGSDLLEVFFATTENPFIGLAVGILATTLVQSSSVTTSMIVALVAAPHSPLPVENAIPMIMGANIGTTVTNTIVSIGHMGRPEEFRRAFAAATCHDFFNFIAVAVFLPLEMATGYLSKTSAALTEVVGLGGSGKPPNPLKTATKAFVEPLESFFASFASERVAAVLLIVTSALVIFTMLFLLVRLLRQLAATRMRTYISRSLDASPYIGMVVGVVVTVMVQSSSITTSVMIPLAGAGIITLRQVFPITLGANVGTTITAILASMAAPEETAHLAVQIALVHLLFNLSGILVVFPLATIREIPLKLASWLADVAVRSKTTAILYVLGLFYGIPALLIVLSKLV